MRTSKILLMVLIGTLILSACSPLQIIAKTPTSDPESSSCSTPELGKTSSCQFTQSATPVVVPTQTVNPQPNLTQSDNQGAITVVITPENLENPGDTLIFDVTLDTHSIDLSMDLAQLATLTTDTGATIQALNWDAPRGGHHVKGKLIFPTTLDGKTLFEGAITFTIIITNLDVPVRQFSWSFN